MAISQTASCLALKPVTGRKHQLRVHCAEYLKAPIYGDMKYGIGANVSANGDKQKKVGPLMLHLSEIDIPDWFGPGLPLKLTAKRSPAFMNVYNTLGLNAEVVDEIRGDLKQMTESNAQQGTE